MHGIICADAYGVPAVQAVFTDKIGGDGFKYEDWFYNFYDRNDNKYDFKDVSINSKNILEIYESMPKKIWLEQTKLDLDKFIKSCPLKK